MATGVGLGFGCSLVGLRPFFSREAKLEGGLHLAAVGCNDAVCRELVIGIDCPPIGIEAPTGPEAIGMDLGKHGERVNACLLLLLRQVLNN